MHNPELKACFLLTNMGMIYARVWSVTMADNHMLMVLILG